MMERWRWQWGRLLIKFTGAYGTYTGWSFCVHWLIRENK